jgi:hypothetical protein
MMSWRTAPLVEVMTPIQRGKAGREQARLELLEGNTQGAGAARLHSFGNQLELSARLVNGDSASYEDGKTILRAEAKKLGLTAEEDD